MRDIVASTIHAETDVSQKKCEHGLQNVDLAARRAAQAPWYTLR
jgi:hypothetical protein